MFVSEKCVLFFEKVRLFSQNDVLFLFYFLINLTMTTVSVLDNRLCKKTLITDLFTRSTKTVKKNGVRELMILLFFIS